MKNKIVAFAFFLSFTSINAQKTFKKLLEVGISNHDSGEYDEAIKYYKQALEIEPDSDLANYEISLSYLTKKDYKKAIVYSDKVLKKGDKRYLIPAYVNKGSSLDMLGKTKKSIKVFEKAIDQLGGWSSVSTIGSGYGRGYSIEHLSRYIDLISLRKLINMN